MEFHDPNVPWNNNNNWREEKEKIPVKKKIHFRWNRPKEYS